MMFKKFGVFSLSLLFIGLKVFSQTGTSTSLATGSTSSTTIISNTSTTLATSIGALLNPPRAPYNPAPYRQGEFPEWAEDLRRAEIVAVGTIPFTFLVSSIFFDTYRYIDKASTGSADALQYAPFFIGVFNPNVAKLPYTSDDIVTLFVSSIIFSAVLAVVDNLILNEQRERLRKEVAEIKRRENQAMVVVPEEGQKPTEERAPSGTLQTTEP